MNGIIISGSNYHKDGSSESYERKFLSDKIKT